MADEQAAGPDPAPSIRAVGGRRFVLAAFVIVASCVMLWFGKVEALIWRDVVLGIAGVYGVANVAGSWVARGQKQKGVADG